MEKGTLAQGGSTAVILYFSLSHGWPFWLLIVMLIAAVFITAFWDVCTMEMPDD